MPPFFYSHFQKNFGLRILIFLPPKLVRNLKKTFFNFTIWTIKITKIWNPNCCSPLSLFFTRKNGHENFSNYGFPYLLLKIIENSAHMNSFFQKKAFSKCFCKLLKNDQNLSFLNWTEMKSAIIFGVECAPPPS